MADDNVTEQTIFYPDNSYQDFANAVCLSNLDLPEKIPWSGYENYETANLFESPVKSMEYASDRKRKPNSSRSPKDGLIQKGSPRAI